MSRRLSVSAGFGYGGWVSEGQSEQPFLCLAALELKVYTLNDRTNNNATSLSHHSLKEWHQILPLEHINQWPDQLHNVDSGRKSYTCIHKININVQISKSEHSHITRRFESCLLTTSRSTESINDSGDQHSTPTWIHPQSNHSWTDYAWLCMDTWTMLKTWRVLHGYAWHLGLRRLIACTSYHEI